jgi:hypothetical protein
MPEIYPYSATVTVGSSRLRVRAEPNTSAPLAGSQILDPGVKVQVKGWCYGECVEGECRWWVSIYGNYFWAGGTIEKPPGTPTPPVTAPAPAPAPAPPPTAPTPAPAAPKEYKVSAPLVAFSQVLPVTFYPEDKIEIRAFNVDDIARVYVDDKLVLTVGYKGDQRIQINPGLSIGNHSIRLTVENTGGGWTYGFDVLKNGSSVLSSPFKEGEAGVTGAKNNDLGIGLVVDIRLGITISASPQIQQEASEWLYQTQQQITQETALSTVPYLTSEEAEKISKALGPLELPSKIFENTVFSLGSLLDKGEKTFGRYPLLFLMSVGTAFTKEGAKTVLESATKAIVPYTEGGRAIVPFIPDMADVLEAILAAAAKALIFLYFVFWAAWYVFIFPIVGAIQTFFYFRNFSFYRNPKKYIQDIVEASHNITRAKLDVVASKIDVVAEKIDVVRKDLDPLIRVAPTIETIPEEIRKAAISPDEIQRRVGIEVQPIRETIFQIPSSLTGLALSLNTLQNSLSETKTYLTTQIQTQTQSVPSQIIPELIRIKTQLEGSIPNNVLGRIAQGAADFITWGNIFKAIGKAVAAAGLLAFLDYYTADKIELPDVVKKPFSIAFGHLYDTANSWGSFVREFKGISREIFAEKMTDITVVTAICYLIQYFLGSLAGYLSEFGLGNLAAMIVPYASYRIVSSRAIGAFTRVAFSRPLTYLLNSAFKTEIPTVREITWWYARGLLDTNQWALAKKLYGEKALSIGEIKPGIEDNVLEMRGLGSPYLELAKVSAFRPLDPFSFAFLSQTGYFVPEEIEFLTRDMGYRPEVRDYLTKAPMMWGLSPFKTSIRTRMMNAVSDGFIEEEKAVRILEKLWRILDMRTVMQLEAQTRYWYETTKDRVDQLMDKAVKDIISEDELRRALSTGPRIRLSAPIRGEERLEEDLVFAVVNPEKLESYIERVRIRKYRKPLEERLPEQKRFILSALINLYSIGKYDASKFVETLNKADTITDFIELAKLRADLEKELDDYKEELRRQKDELKNYLSLIAGILVSEYREGAITKDVLEKRLAEAEQIKDRKTAYIKKAEYERELDEFQEKKRLEKEEVKNYISVVASTLIDCYEEGAITFDRLQSELDIAEKITSRKAAYILKAQWSRFLREFREQKSKDEEKVKEYLSTVAGSIINAFEKGYIDYDTMTSELEFAESVTDKKVAYALKGLWERFNRETDMKIDNLRASLDAGMITEGSFYDEMAKLGVQEWRIQVEIENHEIKTYGKAISVEAKWISEYKAAISILDKIKKAGFMTLDQIRYKSNQIQQMVSPLEILRERRNLETFYDTQRIKVESLAEQYFIDLIDEASLYNELKKIIIVQDILDEVFLKIKGEKAKRQKEKETKASK